MQSLQYRWDHVSLNLANNGYGGACALHPSTSRNFYDTADAIQHLITCHKFTPPILIAHSVSTYTAQKFLESYALRGLVLVNPLPPRTAPAVMKHLQDKWNLCRQASPASKVGDHLAFYYGVPSLESNQLKLPPKDAVQRREDLPAQPFLSSDEALLAFLAAKGNADSQVHLERGTHAQPILNHLCPSTMCSYSIKSGSVPTLLITSDGDRALLSEEDLEDLIAMHNVSPEDTLHFGSDPFPQSTCVSTTGAAADADVSAEAAQEGTLVKGRAPMVTHAEAFNNAVLAWIESVA